MTMAQVIPLHRDDDRGILPVTLAQWRRFNRVAEGEVQEVVAFVRGRPWVGYARDEAEQLALLRRAQRVAGYQGAYLLFNPIRPEIAERYEPGYFGSAYAHRASDAEVTARRAVYVDVDSIRTKGISATGGELSAARDVATSIRELLISRCGAGAVGFGCSGNGFYLLLAIEPQPASREQAERVRLLLLGLRHKFATPAVEIDGSVFNAARLSPAPGTMKCKGANSEERPHRLVSFTCRASAPAPVPLEVIA